MSKDEVLTILANAVQNRIDQLEEQATLEYRSGNHKASEIRLAIDLVGGDDYERVLE